MIMKQVTLWAFSGTLAFLVLSAAFVGWIKYGSGIFLSLAESGLSWCF